MEGGHGGMHEKWHVAYEEALHVPFIVSSPLLPGGARELDIPTNHADLIPTLLGLVGIDPDQALADLRSDHSDAHPLVGRDLSAPTTATCRARTAGCRRRTRRTSGRSRPASRATSITGARSSRRNRGSRRT